MKPVVGKKYMYIHDLLTGSVVTVTCINNGRVFGLIEGSKHLNPEHEYLITTSYIQFFNEVQPLPPDEGGPDV